MKLNEFEKIAKMLAKEHKITIHEGQGWAANLKERKVFYRKEDIYNLSEDHILGLILHEVAHIHYTEEVEMPKNNPELTHSCLNMIEDISIEHIIGKDYPNAEEILESTRDEVLNTLIKILPKVKVSKHEKALLFAAARFEGRGYVSGLEDYEKLGEQIATIMLGRSAEILERKQTKDLMPMVNEIVAILLKALGEPTDQEKAMMAENNRMNGAATETNRQTGAKKGLINSLKSGKGWKGDSDLSNRVAFLDQIADQAAMIGKRLRTILKRNNAMEFGGRYRSGKLLTKRFVRVKAMKDRKPFARRIVKSNQSYAFAIASDVSGSMFDDYDPKQTFGSYALSSMFMVGEALRLAGIPRSMTIFGHKANIVSPMGKKQITFEELGNEKAMRKALPGGTDIGKAIDACREELEKTRAERKIMIILTDGSSDQQEMMEAHKRATQAGIEPLGITIGKYGSWAMESTFAKGKNKIIENTNNKMQIGQAFIDILKESVKQSQ